MKQVKKPQLLMLMMCNTWQTLELLQCIWRFLQFNEELVQVIIRQLVSFLSTAQTTHCLLTPLLPHHLWLHQNPESFTFMVTT